MYEAETDVLVQGTVSPADLSAIRGLVAHEPFLRLQDSWLLVRFIDGIWNLLPGSQREELRQPLVDAFDKHADWMGAFVTSEILGRGYADARALASLDRLGRVAAMPARSLVPHGLEILARQSTDPSLRAAAVAGLGTLATSEIDEVRDEALLSLARVSRPRAR